MLVECGIDPFGRAVSVEVDKGDAIPLKSRLLLLPFMTFSEHCVNSSPVTENFHFQLILNNVERT